MVLPVSVCGGSECGARRRTVDLTYDRTVRAIISLSCHSRRVVPRTALLGCAACGQVFDRGSNLATDSAVTHRYEATVARLQRVNAALHEWDEHLADRELPAGVHRLKLRPASVWKTSGGYERLPWTCC